jgi:beta-phosphoglucomutase-like phosphatase (HAD superfamily)
MVARGKPAPDLFLLAAQRFGAPPDQCVVIEKTIPMGHWLGRTAGAGLVGWGVILSQLRREFRQKRSHRDGSFPPTWKCHPNRLRCSVSRKDTVIVERPD